jgi:hypothetical protein
MQPMTVAGVGAAAAVVALTLAGVWVALGAHDFWAAKAGYAGAAPRRAAIPRLRPPEVMRPPRPPAPGPRPRHHRRCRPTARHCHGLHPCLRGPAPPRRNENGAPSGRRKP